MPPPIGDNESISNEYVLQCTDNLKPSLASASLLFDSVAHDNQISRDEYFQQTTAFQNSSRPASDCGDVKQDSSSKDIEQNKLVSVVITARVADRTGVRQTEDQPEAVISVQDSKPTGSKTLPSVITPMTTSSITCSDSKKSVTMVTTTTGDVSIPVVHSTSSPVAKTMKTTFVSSLSSSPQLSTTRKTVSAVSMTTEPVSTSAHEPAKVNRGHLSDVIVVSSSGQSSRVNAIKDDGIQRLSDPKVGELPKGLVQQRMKV